MATSSTFSTSNQYIKYRIVVTENSYSIEDNTSVVNVKVDAWRTNTGYTTSGSGTCYCTINGTKYSQSISNSQKITHNSHTVLFNRTVTIAHNADGSKTIAVSAYISHDRFTSNSQGFNVKLTTIPRQANITAAPDFYDTDNPTITYSNPAGDIAAITSLQACISLTGAVADVPYRDISKTGTSYTFNLTQSERNTLLAACPNSNTLSVRFIIRTVLSGQTYYSTVIKTMTVKNANPTITGSSYADTNATTTAITQNNQQIIQGNSTISFNFSSLAALKYATLTKIEITVNAVTVSSNLSGSSVSNKTVAFGVINSSSDLTASIKLTDSRGNTTTQSLDITMLAWSLPTAIISCSRLNNYYSETTLNVDALYSSLDSKNAITIQYQYKEVSSSSWSALTTIQDNTPVTVILDNTEQWNLRVIVADRIGSTTYNLVVDRGLPIIYFDRLRRSVGVNCFPSENDSFEVSKVIKSEKGMFAFDSSLSGGSTGYLRIATVKVLQNYANAPIEFRVFRRGDFRAVSLYLCFKNQNNTDPDIQGLYIDSLSGASSFEAFAYKSNDSTWDIYVKKAESYDNISVITNCPAYMRGYTNITYSGNFLSAEPSGAIDATVLT